MVKIRCSAKINLMLNIVGLSNNMHYIDGVFIPFNLYDTIYLTARSDNQINVRYTDSDLIFDNDTALLAANTIMQQYNTSGVDILITKNIPIKSGLGGSSADAAGVAKAMQKVFSLPTIPPEVLLRVGSDVPYMYQGGNCRVQGIGEKISAISLPHMYKIVLLPSEGVSTKECYDLYDKVGGEVADIPRFLTSGKGKFVNALKRAACMLNSEISTALNLLHEAGFDCGMSGSGSACFGIAYSKAEFESKKTKLLQLNHNKFVVLQEEKE